MVNRGISIAINIQKKHVWFLSGLIVLLLGFGLVVAFGGTTPNEMGHSLGEIEDAQKRVTGTCSVGSSIRTINTDGTVVCETDDTGGGLGSLDCQYLHDASVQNPCPEGYTQTGQKPKSSDGHRNYVCCKIV